MFGHWNRAEQKNSSKRTSFGAWDPKSENHPNDGEIYHISTNPVGKSAIWPHCDRNQQNEHQIAEFLFHFWKSLENNNFQQKSLRRPRQEKWWFSQINRGRRRPWKTDSRPKGGKRREQNPEFFCPTQKGKTSKGRPSRYWAWHEFYAKISAFEDESKNRK